MGTDNNSSYRHVNNQCHWTAINPGYRLLAMNTLASRLNEVLAEKEWSQEQLAERCARIAESSDDFDPKDSVSQVAIHKIASGKTKSTRKGPILSAALGVDINWLLTGQGEKHPREHGLTVPPGGAGVGNSAQPLADTMPPEVKELAERMASAFQDGRMTPDGMDLMRRMLDQITGEKTRPRHEERKRTGT